MKLLEKEIERRKEIHENLTTTHMFCFFVMMFALVLSQNLFDIYTNGMKSLRYLIFFGVSFILFEFFILYNKNEESFDTKAKLTWIDFLYVSFPLAIASISLFLGRKKAYNVEAILLLPVIITSSLMGKRAGLMTAATSTILIYFQNAVAGTWTGFLAIMEENIVLISIMFIVGWFVGAQTDLDKRYRMHLSKLASTDLLTGLYNYRYFQERIDEYVKNASRNNPLSLIMLDIDYFKHYNDIHGHQAGDLLLSVFGDILSRKVSNCGFVSRYGGDEFVAVLPGVNSKKALEVAEDIRLTIRNLNFLGEEYHPEGKITISCGIAVCPTHARNARDLINPIVPIILHHHENFNGSGYPAGLKGEEIPILARIIRIADSYDAMISHRAAAFDQIRSGSGTQFDPRLAKVFLEIIQEDLTAVSIENF